MVNFSIVFEAFVNGLLMGSLFGLIAIGFTLVFGVMRIINFAHGELVVIAMYLSYWLFNLWGIDPYVSLIFVIPLLGVLGYIIQRCSIEYIIDSPHSAQIILTFGLLLVFQNALLFFFKSDLKGITGSYFSNTIQIGDARVLLTRVIAFFIAITIMFLLYILLKKTDIGRAIRAASVEQEGAEAVGINFKKIYRISFALGTICAGIAGATSISFLYASPTVGFSFTVKSFIIVVLGGMGSFWGAMIGGIILGLTESFGTLVTSGSMSQCVGFVLLIVILLFRPQGLFGSRTK